MSAEIKVSNKKYLHTHTFKNGGMAAGMPKIHIGHGDISKSNSI